MRKKLIALFLIIVFVSMAGCANNTGSEVGSETATPTENSATSTTDDLATEATAELDIWAAYEDTVTISTVTSEFAAANYPEGDDITNNVWIREYKDKFNVEVVTDWVSDEYDTKVNLSIAEGNLPDVLHVNASQFQQLIDADLIWDLTEVFDTYASDRVKGYMQADMASYRSGMRDGKLYGIPQLHWGYIEQFDYVWIRKDWKEALNLEDPKTMDDVVNICRAFMAEYGGFGMAVDQTLDYLNILAIAWGAHPDLWYENEEGKIVYGSVQPEMKEAVSAWAQWYKEGILSPDFVVTDYAKMNETVVSGETGVHPYYQWWGYEPGSNVVSNLGADAYFEPYEIPSANGEEVIQSVFCSNGSYTVVSKKCKNPEAAIKLINFYAYMIDDSYGNEDTETINAFVNDGMNHTVGAFRVLNPEADYQDYVNITEALETENTSVLVSPVSQLKYDSCLDYLKNGTPAYVGYYLQIGNGRSAYWLGKDIMDNKRYTESKLWGLTPETLLNAGSTLDDILKEGFTKIIVGEESIDYFDTVVQNWMNAGGETATNEMNELY